MVSDKIYFVVLPSHQNWWNAQKIKLFRKFILHAAQSGAFALLQ